MDFKPRKTTIHHLWSFVTRHNNLQSKLYISEQFTFLNGLQFNVLRFYIYFLKFWYFDSAPPPTVQIQILHSLGQRGIELRTLFVKYTIIVY